MYTLYLVGMCLMSHLAEDKDEKRRKEGVEEKLVQKWKYFKLKSTNSDDDDD